MMLFFKKSQTLLPMELQEGEDKDGARVDNTAISQAAD